MTTLEFHFDELDLREEPARTNAAGPDLSGTFHCTTTDRCSDVCTGTKYCN